MAALQVIKDEKLEENAERLGKIFRERMKAIKSDMVELVRGKRFAECGGNYPEEW